MDEKKKGRGGARPGAGRPKSAPILVKTKPTPTPAPVLEEKRFSTEMTSDAKQFLSALMNDDGVDVRIRADAAKALLSAEMRATEAKGKKEAQQEAAEKVASRFAPSAPPKLVAAGGRKL